MKICKICKRELDLSFFSNDEVDEKYFKLCLDCRVKARKINQRHKDDPNYKDKKNIRSKKYRQDNPDIYRAYDKTPKRKAYHKQWLKNTKQKDPCRFIFYSAKRRAKLEGLPFNITKEDINDAYPKNNKCPIFNIELVVNIGHARDNSPTIDKIIAEKGYVKNNIQIISYRANRIKNDSTLEELEKLVNFLKDLGTK